MKTESLPKQSVMLFAFLFGTFVFPTPAYSGDFSPDTKIGQVVSFDNSPWVLNQMSGNWAIFVNTQEGVEWQVAVAKDSLGSLRKDAYLYLSGKVFTDKEAADSGWHDGDYTDAWGVYKPRHGIKLKYLGKTRAEKLDGFPVTIYQFRAIKFDAQSADSGADDPVGTFSASELINVFNKDEASANDQYKGRTIVVSGVISVVSNDPADREPSVTLSNHDHAESKGVLVYFEGPDPHAVVKRLKVGMHVSITSVCQGKGDDGIVYVDYFEDKLVVGKK